MNQIEKEEWRHSRLQSFMSREAAAAETGKQIKEITEWTISFLFLFKKFKIKRLLFRVVLPVHYFLLPRLRKIKSSTIDLKKKNYCLIQ
jgi:hypothetical protein